MHRWYYEQHKGPIPEGLQLDHLCGVRPCLNPDHLEPVTQTENILRSRVTRFTPNKVRAIREAAGTLDEIAAQFDCDRVYAWRLRHRLARQDVA